MRGCTALLDAVAAPSVISAAFINMSGKGANIDAVKEAARFGIGADRAANYHSDSAGTALNYEVLDEAAAAFRSEKFLGARWKAHIAKDFKRRK